MSIKSVEDESGTFSAVLSAYDIVDLANEKTVRGCFNKTIAEEGTNRVMLWGHSQADPIGQLELIDNEKGLDVRAKLCLATTRGKEAYELLKQGVPLGMSIGYIVRKSHFDTDGVRILEDVKLLEGSLTPTPCNQSCMVDLASVKSSGKMTSRFAGLSFLKEMSDEDRDACIKEIEDLIAQDEEDMKESEPEKEPVENEDKTEEPETPAEPEEEKPADDETEEKSIGLIVSQINALTDKIAKW